MVDGRRQRLGWTYEGADCDACGDGGDGAGAGIASDAATGCEGTEEEGDLVERLVCFLSACVVYAA